MSKLTKFLNSPLLYIADGIYKKKGMLIPKSKNGQKSKNEQKNIPLSIPVINNINKETVTTNVTKKQTIKSKSKTLDEHNHEEIKKDNNDNNSDKNISNLRQEYEKAKNNTLNLKTQKTIDTLNNTINNGKNMIEDVLYSNVRFRSEVAIYFDGKIGNIYQIEQWILPLRELHKYKEIVFIVRTEESYDWIRKNTDFPVVLCKLLNDLMRIYERANFKCILYVNNAMRNFQSLIISNAYHIHINHGESDKVSTISNQAKAYDYVAIVGKAAYDKYNNNLLHKDMDKFIQIGRPQLEHIPFISSPFAHIKKPNQKVILYAPTWEATHETMNYTSLDDYGLNIVETILENPDYFLIYKPHPNTGSRKKETDLINKTIIKFISNHERGKAITSGDINSLYPHIDLAIFDNSAVAIDYLSINKPMLMSDMFYKTPNRQDKPIITKAARMLMENDFTELDKIITQELQNDTLHENRQAIKEYYLGSFDYQNQESTKAFINFIDRVCNERDDELSNLSSNCNKIDLDNNLL